MLSLQWFIVLHHLLLTPHAVAQHIWNVFEGTVLSICGMPTSLSNAFVINLKKQKSL